MDWLQWSGSSPPDPTNWDTITYTYDPAGRRIKKNVNGSYMVKYVYDGGHVIAEYDGSNNLLRKYIYGPRVDEPVCMFDVADNNAAYYYHFDGLGSVVSLSNSNGDSCQSYEYSVYGQVAASDPNFLANPYMFTGRRFDIEIRRPGLSGARRSAGRAGLYYYRARYYNPHIGRFMQTDPVGYADGINWYLYCGNNPLNFLDPSGTASFSFSEITDGALTGIGLRCTVIDDDGNTTIYDACDITSWVQWISDKDNIFTDKWMKEQDGWNLSGEDETTFWYLMAINELLGGAEGDGFDYGAMEDTGVRIAKRKQINAFGNPATQSRKTFVNFDQSTDKIYWSENIRWNDPAPIPGWWDLKLTYSPILCLAHELQEAENHLDGANLADPIHGRWSHRDAIRTENLLRREIMILQPKRYPARIRNRYYRPGGSSLKIRRRPPWR